MKKLTIAVLLLLGVGCTQNNQNLKKEVQVDSTKTTLKLHRDKYMDELMQLIRLFDNYYHTTEELLDSAGIKQSVLSSPVGIKYLQNRDALNELFNELEYNSNHKHITK